MPECQIGVRVEVDGLHHWPTPTPERAYLGVPHRHRFGVEVRLPVTHEDREVEFHDLMRLVRSILTLRYPVVEIEVYDFGTQSCEAIATTVGAAVQAAYHRDVSVRVDEDRTAWATVTLST